ncbi:MAG: hypothetical protein ACI8XB_000695 [Patiriisocius sp.]|jgi:hypothetical protein
MKYILLSTLVFILSFSVYAQEQSPVTWSATILNNNDNTVDFVFMANIKDGWHLYSQTLESDKGPIPTSFSFTESDDFELVGKTNENPPRKTYDPNFEMEIAMFEGQAMFSQKLMMKAETMSVSGKISFMVCNDEQCIFPPEEEFLIVKKGETLSFTILEKK